MKDENGITLVALILTVVILLILTGVGISAGIDQMHRVRLKAFYSKLEVAEEAVEKISSTNEGYKDSSGNIIYLKDSGTALTVEQISLISSISENYDTSKFKYFTASEVESILNVSGVDLNLLIDFEDKYVISADGEEIDGTVYYVLENDKYKVQYENKNTGNVDFTYEVKKYGNDTYKITITPININNIKDGIAKYRKYNVDDYWKIANNNEIIIKELISYEIKYIDSNSNSKTIVLNISLDHNNQLIINELPSKNE